MHLADEMLDHLLGDIEIGDDAIPQGPDRLDVAGRAPEHHLGFVTDREDLLLAADGGDRYDRRFVQDDAATLYVNEGVGRAQIDCHVGREDAEQFGKHGVD